MGSGTILTRRAATAAVLIALWVMGGCALPRTTRQDREAFLAKVNVRIRSVTEESANSVDAFAGVIADAAGMAVDVGESQAFAAELLAAVFLSRTIKGGSFTFTAFRGERPGKLQEPIAFQVLRPEELAPPIRANARHLARHVAGALRFPALIHYQTDADRRQFKDALRELERTAGAADRLSAQRLADERRAEVAQDLAALVILRRFHAFFKTPIPIAALRRDIADTLKREASD